MIPPHPNFSNNLVKPSLEAQKVERIREMVRAGFRDVKPEVDLDNFHSGDVISLPAGDTEITGRVDFSSVRVGVTMLSPIKCHSCSLTSARISPPPACRRIVNKMTCDGSNDGSASEQCIRHAVDLLIELYCDWIVVKVLGEDIPNRYASLQNKMPSLLEEDRRRIEEIKKEIKRLGGISHELRTKFKNKEFSQEEYIKLWSPVRNQISKYESEKEATNFYKIEFEKEYNICRRARNPKEIIEAIVMLEEQSK